MGLFVVLPSAEGLLKLGVLWLSGSRGTPWWGQMRVISSIEDQEVKKTILKHLGLWLVTRKPEPRAKGPPRESQIDYSDVQISPAGEYLYRDPE